MYSTEMNWMVNLSRILHGIYILFYPDAYGDKLTARHICMPVLWITVALWGVEIFVLYAYIGMCIVAGILRSINFFKDDSQLNQLVFNGSSQLIRQRRTSIQQTDRWQSSNERHLLTKRQIRISALILAATTKTQRNCIEKITRKRTKHGIVKHNEIEDACHRVNIGRPYFFGNHKCEHKLELFSSKTSSAYIFCVSFKPVCIV